MLEYLGANPGRVHLQIDPAAAARAAAVLSGIPSLKRATKMLRKAGISIDVKPKTILLIYSSLLRMHTLRFE